MKKICFITGTRADYGILSRLIKSVKESEWAQLQIIATNMHLSSRFGMTVNEILSDGFSIDWKIDMQIEKGDKPYHSVNSMALEMKGLAEAFDVLKPDSVVILGDRYEMLVAASAAMMFHIPIVHIHGGEITKGALDDKIRNAITQLSTLHFTATEAYRLNVVKMGADPSKAFNTGALGVENIHAEEIMAIKELNESLELDFGTKQYLLVTFHPATMHPGEEEVQTRNLLNALDRILDDNPALKLLVTMPNSDEGGNVIGSMIEEWGNSFKDRVELVKSLGKKRYYSALKNALAVVGNSSSGLIEAPEFGVPTVNIGCRQEGRAKGNTVIDCGNVGKEIYIAIMKAISKPFQKLCADSAINPYRGENTCEKMMEILKDFVC